MSISGFGFGMGPIKFGSTSFGLSPKIKFVLSNFLLSILVFSLTSSSVPVIPSLLSNDSLLVAILLSFKTSGKDCAIIDAAVLDSVFCSSSFASL